MKTFYNDFNRDSVSWLNQLINNGNISYGVVKGGDFRELDVDELRRYESVHLFAGIGGWDYALQLAGWTGPVWTASLPCQPFSPAGKGKGKDDDRHLLPYFLDLVAKCRPSAIFGEQSPGAIKHGWLDDLQTRLEGEGYTVGHCVLGAHSIGSPHIRNRLYWMAHNSGKGREKQSGICGVPSETHGNDTRKNTTGSGGVVDSEHEQCKRGLSGYREEFTEDNEQSASKFTRSSEIDWIKCLDGKHRPIKPGIFPLANGIPGDMVCSGNTSIQANETKEARKIRIHGYGNAIVPQVAAEFIRAFMDIKKRPG